MLAWRASIIRFWPRPLIRTIEVVIGQCFDSLFACGRFPAAAKKTVAALIAELGFEAVDAGPLQQSRLLEPFALLWIKLALQRGQGREISFQLMRRIDSQCGD
jgi:hypothetical protein